MEKKLGEEYRIFPKDQRKNNELVLHGICVQKGNETVIPMVYVDELAHPYETGELDVEKIADILLVCCIRDGIPQSTADDLTDFGKMKEMVRLRLVNYEANLKELENSPHRKFLDLAITYYLDMKTVVGGQNGAAGITNVLMEIWGVSEDELYNLGMGKLLTEDDCHAIEMLELLRLLAQEEGNELEEKIIAEYQKEQAKPRMYMATNQKHHYGANCMLNKSFLKKMAEDTGCSLIIYPGSVHEIIILPQKNGSEVCMDTDDIKAINGCSVPQNEWLSGSIYRYDREKQEVSIYKEGAPLLW